MTHLISISYELGEDTVEVNAMVDDVVLTRGQTLLDPPEYGPAVCRTLLLWDNPVTEENKPTSKDIEDMLPYINNWEVIPADEF